MKPFDIPRSLHHHRRAAALLLATLLGIPGTAGAEVCNGQVAPLPFDVAPPTVPQEYLLPGDATWVSSTEELQAALTWDPVENAMPKDIILADGIYTPQDLDFDFLYLHGSHRLWAENLGGTVLQFGIHIGSVGNTHLEDGAELHGLAFDIDDETHAASANPSYRSFAVLTWGTSPSSTSATTSGRGGHRRQPGRTDLFPKCHLGRPDDVQQHLVRRRCELYRGSLS